MVKLKKPRFLFGLKMCYILSLVIFLLTSFMVYYFSSDSRVKVLTCTGNYYYTDQQIYASANVSSDTRLWLTPAFMIRDRVEAMPLIDSVQIHRSSGRLEIQVTEKKVIGYYVDKDSNYALTQEGKTIEIDADTLNSIIHFPLLSGFDKDQRKDLAKAFRENEDVLTQPVIEKIAEIIPYESTYDSNMLQITMQDGNKVYTTMDSLPMIAKYTSMLTSLQGKNVCLVLDSANSAIEKINCDDLSGNEKKEEEKEDSSSNENSEDQPETSEDQTTESADESDSEQVDYYSRAQDWQTDANFGLQYSASLNLYYDPGTGTYYTWNDSTLSFDVVN